MIRNLKQVRPLAMLLFGLAVAAGPAYAQGDAPIMEQIDLTKAQRDQIKSLTEQFARETEPLRNDIRRLLDEEKRLKTAPSTNEEALRRKLRERADKEIELSLALTRFHERVENLLSPAQRRKLAELRSQASRR
ncbi:MAG TPA: Spy/CpxP family protein refolding chaperone [Candidatus Kapabacteria bacterium]|jgi:Spy/CpxP family protein refolding chaperone|nr:Spy/CpxP family protein refolding chaperone [Candidatus Kapabacteria bacterium]